MLLVVTIPFSVVLQGEGHTTELTQIRDWNVVELYVNGELVFECDIRNLEYGMSTYVYYNVLVGLVGSLNVYM